MRSGGLACWIAVYNDRRGLTIRKQYVQASAVVSNTTSAVGWLCGLCMFIRTAGAFTSIAAILTTDAILWIRVQTDSTVFTNAQIQRSCPQRTQLGKGNRKSEENSEHPSNCSTRTVVPKATSRLGIRQSDF